MSEGEGPARPAPRPAWVWPLRAPRAVALAAWTAAHRLERLQRGWRWLPCAVVVGALPLLVSVALGLPGHQVVSAVLLWLPFLACVRADRTGVGVGTIAVGFGTHSLLAIALSARRPEWVQDLLPGGPEYWAAQERWITTGQDPEYQPANWIPAHLGLLAAMVGLGYLSLGLLPFLQGFREVDLMNFYVGRLLSRSESSPAALLLGWHAWSLMRGVCYTLLVFEVASWSLTRLAGQETSTPARRRWRWGAGLAFFLLDGILKLFLLEPVRAGLAANLGR